MNMINYIEKILHDYSIGRSSDNPSLMTGEKSNDEQQFIHSGSAKLLYLAIRVRPDILFQVNQLCTKANKSFRNYP